MHVMPLTDRIDDALEITVVGSFTNLGYRMRSRLFDWRAPRDGALEGRTVLVTGPTSGIGRAATLALAGLGARVILAGRDPDRLSGLRDELIDAHGADRFPMVAVDMASKASVQAATRHVLESESRLDVVVDNAGAIHHRRTISPDGIEATLATMVVGPFHLIAGLLPLLRATGESRVISVTSGGQYVQRLQLDDLQWMDETYDGTRAYARAKRAQVSLMREWARREKTVSFAAMHPGWADTPGIADALPPVPSPHGPAPADSRGGRGHDRVARGRPRRVSEDRRLVPRPAAPPVRPSPMDPSVGLRTPTSVGRRGPPGRDRGPAPRSHRWRYPMTTLHERIETAMPIDAVFTYLIDFSHAQEWDPGVESARRLDLGPIGPGSRFELQVRMGGRVAPMTYRVRDLDRPTRMVFEGTGSGVDAVDTISLIERPGGGTIVDYTADIRLGGLLRFVQPLLGGTFAKIGGARLPPGWSGPWRRAPPPPWRWSADACRRHRWGRQRTRRGPRSSP